MRRGDGCQGPAGEPRHVRGSRAHPGAVHQGLGGHFPATGNPLHLLSQPPHLHDGQGGLQIGEEVLQLAAEHSRRLGVFEFERLPLRRPLICLCFK